MIGEVHRYKVNDNRSNGSIRGGGAEPFTYREGTVATPHGYVLVYSQPPQLRRGKGWSTFRFIVAGVQYEMRVDREYTPRGLASLAAKFARTVARGLP